MKITWNKDHKESELTLLESLDLGNTKNKKPETYLELGFQNKGHLIFFILTLLPDGAKTTKHRFPFSFQLLKNSTAESQSLLPCLQSY